MSIKNEKAEQAIAVDVQGVLDLEQQLKDTELALMADEGFQRFIKLQKEFNERSTKVWNEIEKAMIDNEVKSVKGDWGSITIAERLSFTTTDELPKKFYKKVIDTKKLADTFRLEGKVKGATPKYSKFLTKRLK